MTIEEEAPPTPMQEFFKQAMGGTKSEEPGPAAGTELTTTGATGTPSQEEEQAKAAAAAAVGAAVESRVKSAEEMKAAGSKQPLDCGCALSAMRQASSSWTLRRQVGCIAIVLRRASLAPALCMCRAALSCHAISQSDKWFISLSATRVISK